MQIRNNSNNKSLYPATKSISIPAITLIKKMRTKVSNYFYMCGFLMHNVLDPIFVKNEKR